MYRSGTFSAVPVCYTLRHITVTAETTVFRLRQCGLYFRVLAGKLAAASPKPHRGDMRSQSPAFASFQVSTVRGWPSVCQRWRTLKPCGLPGLPVANALQPGPCTASDIKNAGEEHRRHDRLARQSTLPPGTRFTGRSWSSLRPCISGARSDSRHRQCMRPISSLSGPAAPVPQ